MLITDYLDSDCIITDLGPDSKEALISQLAEVQFEKHVGLDREEALTGLIEREKVLSTGIGNGIAIPHARISSVDRITVSFGLVKEAVDFDAIDAKPVRIICLIFFPSDDVTLQLRFLARVSRLLSSTELRETLLDCRTPAEIIDAFSHYEAQHFH